MRNTLLHCAIVISIVSPFTLAARSQAQGRVRVRGYITRSGTYVMPHWRTAPDGIASNNYSFPGNYNPNTGSITPGLPLDTLGGCPAGADAVDLDSYLRGLPSLPDMRQPNPAGHVLPVGSRPLVGVDAGGGASGFLAQMRAKNVERANYWKQQGYRFDPETTSAFMMDMKVKDIERARYWKQQGYTFDPETTSAFMMDMKVKDIERARYWKQQGYKFDPQTTSAFMMDMKVKDIERANYWKRRGYNFNPDTMTAFMMDMKVKEIEHRQ